MRRGKEKYYCTTCTKWFQVNRVHNDVSDAQLTLLHLDGISFRTLSDQFSLSVGSIYHRIFRYLQYLPHCADISRHYCARYSGIVITDGKYVRIKGYDRKVPVLYGIDYLTHDIPTYYLAPSENYQSCIQYFGSLKLLNYPLQALVCDENVNIFEACRFVYPHAITQLCQNHYKENIRTSLDLAHNHTYRPFMKGVEDLFVRKRSPDDFNRKAKNLFNQYQHDTLCASILIDIYRQQDILCAWRKGTGIPTTTNLIECFNSHLQDRLKALQGFESRDHADLWLNAYFLRRRTKRFTGCTGKFRYLNGYNSLQKSKKPDVDIPLYFNQKRDRF